MTSREPNFATALRMLDLLLALDQRHYGWPVAEAAEALEVDPRTIKRYVRALGTRLVMEDGRPAVRIVHHDRQPCIVVSRPILQFEAGLADQASLYLGRCFLQAFLPGSGLDSGLEELRKELAQGIHNEPLADDPTTGNMSQKLVVQPRVDEEGPSQQVLSTVMTALVSERQLRLEYYTGGPPELVDPLSLCLHGNLWELIVRQGNPGTIRTIKPGSIRQATLGNRFKYPADWKPPSATGG